MSANRVIIEVAASRVGIAVVKGASIERSEATHFARTEWTESAAPNAHQLDEAKDALASLAASLNVSGALATVVYTLPGAVVSVTSCPASLKRASAEQAAQLAVASLADFPLDDAPPSTAQLLVDASPKDPTAQQHLLTIADAEQRVALIADVVEAAGFVIDRVVPAESVAMIEAVRRATAPREDESVLGVIYLGEHCCAVAAGVPGRLLFVRALNWGTELLVEALTRPLRPRSAEDGLVQLSHDQARRLLMTLGVPSPDADVPDHPTLGGSSLLPPMQPLLQRLGVECKQSLKFGVTEQLRGTVRIAVIGPGSGVRGLGEAVSRISGFASIVGMGPQEQPSHVLVGPRRISIGLQCQRARQSAMLMGMRRALVVGCALGAGLVGFDALDAHNSLRAERAKLQRLSQAANDSGSPVSVLQGQAIKSREGIVAANARIEREMGATSDFGALMSVFAQTTPDVVNITSLELSRPQSTSATASSSSGETRLAVRGFVAMSDVADVPAVIADYVRDLSASPIISSVRLGPTSRMAVAYGEAQSFELSVSAVALPAARLNSIGLASTRPTAAPSLTAPAPVTGSTASQHTRVEEQR